MFIYLGPEDRHPRLLYWCVLTILGAELVFGVLRVKGLRDADSDQVYFHRVAFGTVMSAVMPAVVRALVWVGKPVAAIVYAALKGMSCVQAMGFAYGSSFIGKGIRPAVIDLFVGWNVLVMSLLVAYAVYRLRGDRAGFRLISRRQRTTSSIVQDHDESTLK